MKEFKNGDEVVTGNGNKGRYVGPNPFYPEERHIIMYSPGGTIYSVRDENVLTPQEYALSKLGAYSPENIKTYLEQHGYCVCKRAE